MRRSDSPDHLFVGFGPY